MCWSRNSKTLSWLGILWGLLSLATLLTAFLSNVWLYTREPTRFPNSDILTTVTFKIGLWRICPTFKLTNTTPYAPHLSCTTVKYSSWEDITAADLGIPTPLEFTPSFLSKMRISTLFGAASIVLIFLATASALVGFYNSDHKTIVACGLFILGGLTLGGGLLIFASVLSDAYFERPKRSHLGGEAFDKMASSGSLFDYKYGWSFFVAGAAFFMSELAAVLSISAYIRRFPTVEDMVRIMVPGAERRLKERHGLASEYLVQHKNKYQTQDADASATLSTGSKRKNEGVSASDFDGAQRKMFLSKPAPDICTSNPAALSENIIDFGNPATSSNVLFPSGATYCANPGSPYILGEMGSVMTNSASSSPLRDPLAGHTVPIVLMHQGRKSSGTPFMLSGSQKDSKKNFKMCVLPPGEGNKTVAFPLGHWLDSTEGGELSCFNQSFYPNQPPGGCEGHLNEVNFNLQHLSSDLGASDSGFFGTFHSEKTFSRKSTLDQSLDIPGAFSTTSSSSGAESGTTVNTDSSASSICKKKNFLPDKKPKKSITFANALNKLETCEHNAAENNFFDDKSGLS